MKLILKILKKISTILYIDMSETTEYEFIQMDVPGLIKKSQEDILKEVTDDGIPTIRAQIAKIQQEELEKRMNETDETKKKNKDIKMMVKVLALNKMNLHPLFNTYYMNGEDREILIEHMKSYMGVPLEEIKKEFYKVCNKKIFTEKADYSSFVVYDA